MASLPPPKWRSSEPTEDEYLTLLRHECRHQGLVDWNDNTTFGDIVAANPFKPQLTGGENRYSHLELSWEEWSDPNLKLGWGDFFNGADEEEEDVSVGRRRADKWKQERKELLEKYAKLHLESIKEKTRQKFIAAGGIEASLTALPKELSMNQTLYWLGALWKLEEDNKNKQPEVMRKATILPIIVFSDIDEEESRPVKCQIAYDEPWFTFRNTFTKLPLDEIWPPEGFICLRDYDDSIVHPEMYSRRADLVYDNEPGRGWYAHVIPKEDIKGMLDKLHDWRAIDTEEDWASLMHYLRSHRQATVAMRHHSTKERIDFVAKKRVEEAIVEEPWGPPPFNTNLRRHRAKMLWGASGSGNPGQQEGQLDEHRDEDSKITNSKGSPEKGHNNKMEDKSLY